MVSSEINQGTLKKKGKEPSVFKSEKDSNS